MGLPFTIAAGPRQRSHSHVRVPRDSWPHFTVSDSRLPQHGGAGPRIYIPQEQGGPVIPPGTGFPFRHLLRLARLRWRHSTPTPHGIVSICSEFRVQNYFTTGCLPPISLSWRQALWDPGLMTRYLLLRDSYGLVFLGRRLWREDRSVFSICCWPSPA
jgi:hypothetical protein